MEATIKSRTNEEGTLKRVPSARRYAMPDVLHGINQCDILLLNLDYEVKQEKQVEVQKFIDEKAFEKALDNVIQMNRRLRRVNSAEKQFINEKQTISTIMDELHNELGEMIKNDNGPKQLIRIKSST